MAGRIGKYLDGWSSVSGWVAGVQADGKTRNTWGGEKQLTQEE